MSISYFTSVKLKSFINRITLYYIFKFNVLVYCQYKILKSTKVEPHFRILPLLFIYLFVVF